MIQEITYPSVIFFGKTIFSEHLKKENMFFLQRVFTALVL